jgi:hypothetical protein
MEHGLPAAEDNATFGGPSSTDRASDDLDSADWQPLPQELEQLK